MATGALRDSTSRGLGTGRGCGKGPQGQDREGVEGSRKGDRVPRGRIRVGTGSPGAGWGWGQGPQGQGRHGAVSHRSRSSGARGGSGPAAPGEGSGPGSAPRSPWRPRRVGPGLALSAEALRARPSPGTGQASVPPLKAAAGAGRPLGISQDGASPPSRAFSTEHPHTEHPGLESQALPGWEHSPHPSRGEPYPARNQTCLVLCPRFTRQGAAGSAHASPRPREQPGQCPPVGHNPVLDTAERNCPAGSLSHPFSKPHSKPQAGKPLLTGLPMHSETPHGEQLDKSMEKAAWSLFSKSVLFGRTKEYPGRTHRNKLRAGRDPTLPATTLPPQGTGNGGTEPLGGSGELLGSSTMAKNTPMTSCGQMDSTGCGKEGAGGGERPLSRVSAGQGEWDRRVAKRF